MFIRMPKGIRNSDEVIAKIWECIGVIDDRLLVADKNQDVIKVVIDSVNKLNMTVYDGVIIISCDKVVRKFYAFDYDTANEWIYAAAELLSQLINSTVRFVYYYNKHKKCVKQEIYRLHDEKWKLIISIPKTVNLFAASSKKLQSISNTVTFTQQ